MQPVVAGQGHTQRMLLSLKLQRSAGWQKNSFAAAVESA